ncbi:helix-turn-helix domain-containing protein [Paenibacillus macquariensis]|uniref:Helix-turn-helix n=1 Tax=Paenibacillus macquariensis TaxID=948756 RepID=A0ABY1JW97_9BACL|nr:helix-turn-helix transcriptional regulator [Paenibacillus macquariensis]MEC0094355.1 helix-turn-helix transcriptional regulator [Paenibacillus macquariensis]SIQ87665.1 Helix-turn-helix [Paenibacillus macquariensis]
MDVHIIRYVGERIRGIRKSKGYTQEQLGEKVGLPQSYIGGIERGDRNISLETLERILDALEHTPTGLFRFYNDEYLSEDRRAKEVALNSLNELLTSRSVHDINMIQQLAKNILFTIDSHVEKH